MNMARDITFLTYHLLLCIEGCSKFQFCGFNPYYGETVEMKTTIQYGRVTLTCKRGIFVTIPNENFLEALSCCTKIWISERLSGTSTWYYL